MAIDNKKEQEREELHRAIWAIADELRGAVDGWDFKSYVLGTMFYRYISENLTSFINQGEEEAGDAEFDYASLSDEEAKEQAHKIEKKINKEYNSWVQYTSYKYPKLSIIYVREDFKEMFEKYRKPGRTYTDIMQRMTADILSD